MSEEFWCLTCGIQFMSEGDQVRHQSSYEHIEKKKRKENNAKVQEMPFNADQFYRFAREAISAYMQAITPKIDPHAQEKTLFDQVVLMFITHGSGSTQAVESAMHIIRARRELEKENKSTSSGSNAKI